MVRITVRECDIERFKPAVLSGVEWEELKACNLPLRQLYYALQKDTIPPENAKLFYRTLKDKRFQFLFLYGDIGTGKTTLGIRYLIKLLSEGNRPILYLISCQLREVYNGTACVLSYEHELLGYRSKVSSVWEEGYKKLSFPELCTYYKVIMIDDLKETEIPALSELVEIAYQTGTHLIVTTNLYSLKELSTAAKSRLDEMGQSLCLRGEDLRKLRLRK